ncbi:hypothetical protein SUGI_0346650 [Cryptomeria japonica]|nr:hypothetical protein SUGI_0346650 [Cryptomeria japonica]
MVRGAFCQKDLAVGSKQDRKGGARFFQNGYSNGAGRDNNVAGQGQKEEMEKEVNHNEKVFLGTKFWEDNHLLMLKPWHLALNPLSKSFDRIPLWIRLPNLSMPIWFDSYFEAVGNSLSNFSMVLDGEHKDVNEKDLEIETCSGTPKSWEIKQGMTSGSDAEVKDGDNVGSCFDQAGREKVQVSRDSVSKMGCVTGEINIGLQSPEIRDKDVLGVSNLKLLENAREEGLIEVKRKKEKRAKEGSIGSIPCSLVRGELNQQCNH